MASPAKVIATQQLIANGQSPWLDYIRRDLLESGGFKKMVGDGWVTGVTSNPTIFEKAIAGSNDYDAAMAALAKQEPMSAYDSFVSIASDDIRDAADGLRPIYEATSRVDGYVSFELPPGLEHDTAGSVKEAKRLFALLDRPNVMIKVPGTAEGCDALRELTAAGVNPNMTLLFSISMYESCVEAYFSGLEQRLAAGLPLDHLASVASFFVSRVDTAVDAQLPEGSPLRGKVAIANARVAYKHFMERHSGPRWEKLKAAGARAQRPLWASTGTKNKAYSDVLYVESLVAEHTVNTMPEATIQALLDHGNVRPSVVDAIPGAERDLAAAKDAGIDLDAVTAKLLSDGLASFQKDFTTLLDRVESGVAQKRGESRRA
ncbi:MAG TPA: transaldolase [Tepidiformaceae bacterium]|jgi:transaldolase|nr:transaldolase [Tepidiformaceae bacterium]